MKKRRYNNEEIYTKINIIKLLINEKKYNLAWKMVDEVILKYPDDEKIKFQIVCLKLIEGNYFEALNILEELTDERNFIIKTELYVMLGMEDKEFYMYKKYFEYFNFDDPFFIHDNRYRMLYIYLNKKFNSMFNLPSFLGVNYLEKQIYSYDKNRALENIKMNHFDLFDMEKGMFFSHINIEELYNKANAYIVNNRGILKYGRQVFKFYYPNCGVVATNEVANGFCVVTTLSDKNIIAIYPCIINNTKEAILYEENRYKSKRKIKVRSGIERFNSRYNKLIYID